MRALRSVRVAKIYRCANPGIPKDQDIVARSRLLSKSSSYLFQRKSSFNLNYFRVAAGERKEVVTLFRRIEVITSATRTNPLFLDGMRYDWNPGTMLVACHAMVESGLPDPNIPYSRVLRYKRRIRFFFTERGWRQCGHKVLAEIRSKNLKARVIAIKEKDPRIAIIYRDAWQIVAIFNPRRNRNHRYAKSREGDLRSK